MMGCLHIPLAIDEHVQVHPDMEEALINSMEANNLCRVVNLGITAMLGISFQKVLGG